MNDSEIINRLEARKAAILTRIELLRRKQSDCLKDIDTIPIGSYIGILGEVINKHKDEINYINKILSGEKWEL